MYARIALNLFLIFCVFLLQLGFISGLPLYLNSLNLILIFLVFLLETKTFKIPFIWAFTAGFLMDLYYFNIPGNYLFSLLISLFLMNFLLKNFFTNRSLYSYLALIFFGNLIFKIIWYFYNFVLSFILKNNVAYTFNFLFFKKELISLGINILAVAIGFYIISFIGSNFKPVFLLRKKR